MYIGLNEFKKTELIEYVLSYPYSIAGIWDVAALLPGCAAGPLYIRGLTHIIQSWKNLKQVKISIRVDNSYPLLLKYHYVLIIYCTVNIMFITTIVKCSIAVVYILF